jgi:hypothetical protein
LRAIGAPPNTAARLLRRARSRSSAAPDSGRLAEIALDCGCYEQAHLNRDLRELAEASPGAFVARLLPDWLGVAAS